MGRFKDFKNTTGGTVLNAPSISNNNGVKNARITVSGSHFYSPAELMAMEIGRSIEAEGRRQPVRQLDPKAFTPPPLSALDLKRAKAVRLAQKYYSHRSFFRDIIGRSRQRPLTEEQCEAVFRLVKQVQDLGEA